MVKTIALPFLFISHILMAADIRTGNSITISQPVYQDLYITAGTIIINAPVYGDLIVAGGTITINDSIANDLLITGGSVTVNGYVGDDIRCAAGNLLVSGQVEGDMFIAGGSVQFDRSAKIRSLYVTGGNVKLNGNVQGNVTSRAGNMEMDATITGDADLRGGKLIINGRVHGKTILAATSKIVIGKSALFSRSVHYWQPFERRLVLPRSSAEQAVVYDPLLSISHSKWYFLGASTFLGLLWYLGMAYILILIIQFLFPAIFSKAAKSFHTSTLKSLAYGAAFFVGIPVGALVALITIIGVPVAAILMITYIVLLLLATIVSSLVIVHWVMYISNRNWNYWRITGTALFTFMLLKIIAFTPFFGWLLMMGIVLISYGSLIKNIRLNIKRIN